MYVCMDRCDGCMYLCMHACMYVCMYVYGWMDVCMYRFTYTRKHTYIHTYIHTYTTKSPDSVYFHPPAASLAQSSIQMYVYTHAYMHIQAFIHTKTLKITWFSVFPSTRSFFRAVKLPISMGRNVSLFLSKLIETSEWHFPSTCAWMMCVCVCVCVCVREWVGGWVCV